MKFLGWTRLLAVVASIQIAHGVEPIDPCERNLLPTSELVPYLEALVDEQILSVADIERFAANLERGVIANPIPAAAAGPGSLVHARTMNQLLQTGSDLQLLQNWAQRFLERRGVTAQQKHRTEELTRPGALSLNFIRVHGRKVKNPSTNVEQEYDIGDFEISDTFVTAQMWAEFLAAQSAPEGDVDRPVTTLTWWDATMYANWLSRARGLPPAYEDADRTGRDLTKNTPPEFIAKMRRAGAERLRTIEGYRLPSYAEMYLINEELETSNRLVALNDPNQSFQLFLHEWGPTHVKSVMVGRYVSGRFSTINLDSNDYDRTLGFRLVRSLPSPSGGQP